ncbi:MAG TPA: signal peptidase I, partial [Pirellulaceae bacterium]
TPLGGRRFVPYTGDRILVNKFAYQTADPERWDVIVFKYPGNAKQNYIKRLVGLPNETLTIRHGDVFTSSSTEDARIARKPPRKLPHVMQLVHDTAYLSRPLVQVGWPSAWFDVPQGQPTPAGSWTTASDQQQYTLDNPSREPAWLRYRHVFPSATEWRELARGHKPSNLESRRGELITDFYGYNSWHRPGVPTQYSGTYWVGDLGLEADVQVRSREGKLWLDLVEGGRHHQCEIDVATGQATATIDGGKELFEGMGGTDPPSELQGATRLRGPGKYHLRWVNADDQLCLWIDDRLVAWSAGGNPHPGHYPNHPDTVPHWTPVDAGDLNPVGIGGSEIQLTMTRLRVLRDIYYSAKQTDQERGDYPLGTYFAEVMELMAS